jgi:hypothetical protein
LKPGELVVAMLPGAVETKVRPAVVIASETYLAERPDVIVGILTTKIPSPLASTDYLLRDWQAEDYAPSHAFVPISSRFNSQTSRLLAVSAARTGLK